jgi:hypothetical protein
VALASSGRASRRSKWRLKRHRPSGFQHHRPWDSRGEGGRVGCSHFRARYYDPASGRFLNEDPVAGLFPVSNFRNLSKQFLMDNSGGCSRSLRGGRLPPKGRCKAMPRKRPTAEVLAEVATGETRQFVRRVRRPTRRKFTPEEKVGSCWRGSGERRHSCQGRSAASYLLQSIGSENAAQGSAARSGVSSSTGSG